MFTKITWARAIRAAHRDTDGIHSSLRAWRKMFKCVSDPVKVKQFYDELDALLANR